MKLRIRGDSLRLRLTRSEVAALLATGHVSERMHLPAGRHFEYRLVIDALIGAPGALLEQGAIVVRLPKKMAESWARSETVGIEAREANGLDSGLLILVEKDFPCLTPRAHEDDSDAFARPDSEQPPSCGPSDAD